LALLHLNHNVVLSVFHLFCWALEILLDGPAGCLHQLIRYWIL